MNQPLVMPCFPVITCGIEGGVEVGAMKEQASVLRQSSCLQGGKQLFPHTVFGQIRSSEWRPLPQFLIGLSGLFLFREAV